jgi:lipopolysaccharide transport system ATP-binding protein
MTVIKVENLSKMYDLGLIGTGTLSKDLNRAWAKLQGKPDPYTTLAELNDRTQKSTSGSVWALKDINFKVQQGEVLGIIGKNGAGKSTLLKILSQITTPSTGDIKIKGRVASLLEVGTGMHPEMTARENIYLNGAIMGMTRSEITSKLDEIVDFAGIGKYIDTPIKRFSSGMKVRLGFAVAAFLEPEILIIDEVLAVGDAEFQKKAIGKMQDVSKGGGRTVLFVSHNMASVQNLCTSAIVMKNGTIDYSGSTEKAIDYYLGNSYSAFLQTQLADRIDRKGGYVFRFTDSKFVNNENQQLANLVSGINCRLLISYKLEVDLYIKTLRVIVFDNKGVVRFIINSSIVGATPKLFTKTEKGSVEFIFKKFPLPPGEYTAQLTCFSENGQEDDIEGALTILVEEGDYYNTGNIPKLNEGVLIDFDFKQTLYEYQ